MLVVDGVKTPESVIAMPRWRVDIVRKHAEHLGIVTAPSAQEALHRAVSLFRIKPDHYSKFIITKIEEYELGRYTD
jgi:predicted metal-dependent phosphoesterase TrpH